MLDEIYVAPAVIEAGDFTKDTAGTATGRYWDGNAGTALWFILTCHPAGSDRVR